MCMEILKLCSPQFNSINELAFFIVTELGNKLHNFIIQGGLRIALVHTSYQRTRVVWVSFAKNTSIRNDMAVLPFSTLQI